MGRYRLRSYRGSSLLMAVFASVCSGQITSAPASDPPEDEGPISLASFPQGRTTSAPAPDPVGSEGKISVDPANPDRGTGAMTPEAADILRRHYEHWVEVPPDKTMTGDWGGFRTDLEKIGIGFNLYYMQQYQENLRGGISARPGKPLSGSYDFHPQVDFGRMGLVPGLSFFMEVKGAWGYGINSTNVGALFLTNQDILGDFPIFVNKWWFKQLFLKNKIELRAGVMESKKDDLFDIIPYARHEDIDFLSRPSIFNSTIPHVIGMGAFLKVMPVEWLYFKMAALDAKAIMAHTGFDTAFHGQAWYKGFWETGYTPYVRTARGPMPGKYYAGFWYDPTVRPVFMDTLGGRREQIMLGHTTGMYLGAAQMVWKENSDPHDTQGLGLFARYGDCRDDVNKVGEYWEVGASYKGLFPKRDDDVFGFAVSQNVLSEQYIHYKAPAGDRETIYEWYYAYQPVPWFVVSPDLQIITDPGALRTARDAIVAGVRIRVTF